MLVLQIVFVLSLVHENIIRHLAAAESTLWITEQNIAHEHTKTRCNLTANNVYPTVPRNSCVIHPYTFCVIFMPKHANYKTFFHKSQCH